MQKENIAYRTKELQMEYLPTKDRNFRLPKTVKVQAPQYVECTYDVGLEVLRELDSTCFAVYMALLSYRNSLHNDCHPSIDRIHEDFHINKKAIKRAIDLLYEKGYININSGSRNIANNYYFMKEYWADAWGIDFYQDHARRRFKVMEEDRETKEQKLIRELKEENERLKKNQAKNVDLSILDDEDYDEEDPY